MGEEEMDAPNETSPVTSLLAAWISEPARDPFSKRALQATRHAVLDWMGVTVAGASEPLVDILVNDAIAHGESGACSVIGTNNRLTPATAALVNGAASHALDFDDINKRMRGHPTVTIIPALLAAAHGRKVTGAAFVDALAAGTEIACILGEMIGEDHYKRGFHATATVGTLSAAAACARLLAFPLQQTETALNLAATQAAGLQAMFGSMGKPLHAGLAARNGLCAARWASAGFVAGANAIDAKNGFGPTHSSEFQPAPVRSNRSAPFGIEENIFKYHAACYYTHSAIEAARQLMKSYSLSVADIEKISIFHSPTELRVCNIAAPRTGLEIKFSIRHLVSMALLGIDTSHVDIFTEDMTARADVNLLREKSTTVPELFASRTCSRVTITMADGAEHTCEIDVGQPSADLDEQEEKLSSKFLSLTTPHLGPDQADHIAKEILSIGQRNDLHGIFEQLCG